MNEHCTYQIAVIIPCWNCEAYIGEMLDCLLNQTFTDWKAFLVDDGSTDRTAAIINDYALKDARINYVQRNRNPKGAQTCRNIGFELSEGAKYVVFFDADDLIAPYCLEQRVEYLEKYKELDFAIFPMKSFQENIYDENNWVWGVQFVEDNFKAFLNWNLPFVVVTNIYCRQSLVDYDLAWDERLLSMQDSVFNIHALALGMRYEYAQNVKFDYFYRIGHNGLAKKIMMQKHFDSHFILLKDVTEVLVRAYGEKYDFYIQNYILIFLFQIFCDDRKALLRMISMPYVKKHSLFRVRLVVYLALNRRGRSYIFSKYLRYSRSLRMQWEEHMKSNADKFRLESLRSWPISN